MSKSVLLSVVAVFAMAGSSAFASSYPTANDSLETILSSRGVLVDVPTVRLEHAFGSFTASIADACIDGQTNQVRLNAGAVKVCVRQVTMPRTGTVCREHAVVTPVSPVVVTETFCAKWEHRYPRAVPTCARYAQATTDFALPVELQVRRKLYGRGMSTTPGSVLFTKEFSIPACQQ